MVTWMQDSGAGSGVEGIADTEHTEQERVKPLLKQNLLHPQPDEKMPISQHRVITARPGVNPPTGQLIPFTPQQACKRLYHPFFTWLQAQRGDTLAKVSFRTR